MKSALFILKKSLAGLLYPSGLIFCLALAGLLTWLIRPGRRIGPTLLAASAVLLLAFSMPMTAHLALAPLENWAGDYAKPLDMMAAGVKDVVVLSGGCLEGNLSLIDQVGPVTTRRLMEGVRLWRGVPGAKLIVSGGSLKQGPKAEAMAELAAWLGVPQQALVVESNSWDTIDQALMLKRTLGKRPFALVTSASHLPRSMYIFKSAGLNPIPAPADFRARGFRLGPAEFRPELESLNTWDRAVHEYLGLAWTRLLVMAGRLKP